MVECKMEDMSLPTLFEQARKIHLMATESGADQVRSFSCLIQCSFTAFLSDRCEFLGYAGYGRERMRGAGEVRGHDKQARAFLI